MAAWPVLRAIWWWAPETVITGSLVFGWIELADHTTLIIRLTATAAIVGVPAAIRPVRTRLHQVTWCLVTRHRIRTSFSEFIIKNRTGSLPLILWARPTPVGERVWIWLRPGLSIDDLLDRLDKIAVACWATAALAEAASRSNAAFVRLDIKRRDVLTGTITSPLLDMIKSGTPATERDTAELPTALDLPQVAASEVTPIRPTPLKRPPPPDARPGVTPGPGCQRRQRHHRLDLIQPGTGATPPPGRFFPGRLAPITHARRNPTPRPCPAWGSPPPRKENRHDRPRKRHRPGRADAVHVRPHLRGQRRIRPALLHPPDLQEPARRGRTRRRQIRPAEHRGRPRRPLR